MPSRGTSGDSLETAVPSPTVTTVSQRCTDIDDIDLSGTLVGKDTDTRTGG
jgi:hypothetical protein